MFIAQLKANHLYTYTQNTKSVFYILNYSLKMNLIKDPQYLRVFDLMLQ